MAVYQNEGYQIVQSLFAIGTGGWFGMGLCQGSPEKIPVVKNDFIFSAICEELGGVPYHWRCYQIHTYDRCDSSSGQLWRKFHYVYDFDDRYYPGLVYL